MTQISSLNNAQNADLSQIDSLLATVAAKASESLKSLPDAQFLNSLTKDSGLPELDTPTTAARGSAILNMSQEAMEAIMNMAEREMALDSGKNAIKARAEKRKTVNEQRVNDLKEQVAKAEKASFWDKLVGVFKAIGAVVGAIVGAVAMVAAVTTGNVALGIGAGFLILSSLDSVASSLSDGKVSIAAGIASIDKDSAVAKWIGFGLSLAIGITGAILTGVGAMQSAQTLSTITNVATRVGTITSAATQVASGAGGIVSAVYKHDAENATADIKKLQAILQRLKAADDSDTDQIKKILEKAEAVADGVKKLIDNCNETMHNLVSASPSMA
ncbi:MAG: type III secretion system translocon subunit SctE [Succinivibrio sp.]